MSRWSGALAVALLHVAPTVAMGQGLEDWLPNLERGVAAARESGKPILVATCWKKYV